jgi:hypothetical protein
LGARYGAAAVGWLGTLVALGLTSRLWQQRSPEFHDAGRHLAVFLYRIGWEVSGCPSAFDRPARVVFALLLLALAAVGLARSLARQATRGFHVALVGFILLVSAVVILGDPYSKNNLRETFLPVVGVLFYAAEGLRRAIESAVAAAVRDPRRLRAGVLLGLTAVLAALAARDATRFVERSSNEPDYRVPAAVGRRLARMGSEAGQPLRVVSLSDNNAHVTVVAAYARLPVPTVEPLTSDLPAGATHVLYIPWDGQKLTHAAIALKQELEDGRIAAQPERIEGATLWTLLPKTMR